jgi:hypothetical protein
MKKWIFTLLGVCAFAWLSAQELTVPKTQRSIVTKLSATWCPICGGSSWDTYERMLTDNAKNALVVAMHRSTISKLYSPTATEILATFETTFSQPWFYVNAKLMGQGSATDEASIKTEVNNAAKTVPIAQTAMRAVFKPGTREITLSNAVEYFQTANADLYLAFYLIEKQIVEEQDNRSPTAVHKNVLRTALTPSTFGNQIAVAGKPVAVGTRTTGELKYILSPMFKPENITIAAVIWRKNGSKYELVNVNTLETVETTTAVEDPQLAAGFSVAPNVLSDQTWVKAELPTSGKQVEVAVFNLFGQQVRTLHRGALAAGSYQWSLQRGDLTTSGFYIVRVMVDGQFAVKNLLVP